MISDLNHFVRISSLAIFGETLAATLFVALLLSLLVVVTSKFHGRFSMDHPGAVQKFHLNPTPRIGGVGIYFSLLVAWYVIKPSEARQILGAIVVAGLPAFLFGVIEDFTKRVSVRSRLIATMASGALVCILSGSTLSRLDIPLIDDLLQFTPVAILFTAFAVGGVANAINIVDGFHGLASGVGILAFIGLGLLAMSGGDVSVAAVAFLGATALAGFWLVNYPWGKLFLGDGGAYFTGFVLAWLAVLIPARNPAISPWACLLVCSYPIIEVLYSIARRMFNRMSPGDADSKHLHSLLATQLIRRHLGGFPHTLQNAAVAPFIWLFVAGLVVISLLYRESTSNLMIWFLGAVAIYHFTYRTLRRLPTPAVPPGKLVPRTADTD
ncbi:MAG: glycosyltransferase family 4 protein [Hydrogenophaga sp.]|nr:glycosyltransferase family 4 protein [Hydrogenophaga sp.]